MRGLFNSVVILFILATLALVAFFVNERQKASYRGDTYSFFQAPVDLADEVSNFFSSSEPPRTRPTGDPAIGTGTAGIETPGESPSTVKTVERGTVDHWQQGRKYYLAGDYGLALDCFKKARTRPAGQSDPIEGKARLFRALLGDEPVGADLNGPAQALITLPGGAPFYAEVVSENDDEITFKRPDGVGARLDKSALRDLAVARTPAEKRKLAEREYQRRHRSLAEAKDYLELGRFCYANDLCDHLTYLLERGLDAPGNAYEAALFEEYKRLRATTGAAARADETAAVMKEFYRSGEFTKAVVLDSLPGGAGRPGIGVAPPDTPDGTPPASGIGASNYSMPRSTNPKVNALIAKADAVRREADGHYLKAAPGNPDRGTHRDKAIELYEEAIGMYEAIEESWGVNLDSIFKDMLTKRYGLLKDKPIR